MGESSTTDSQLVQKAIRELETAIKGRKEPPRLFAGADGFIDEIIRVVNKRFDVDRFEPIRTIGDYARRLAGAAGKSTNIEFFVERVKSGGNGPLLSEAFGRLGGWVRYVGCVGSPEVDPIFQHLADYGEVVSLGPAAVTLATEFDDGKIMHGKHQALKDVNWENFRTACGGDEGVDRFLRDSDVFSLINWTMTPFMTEIIRGVLDRLPGLEGDGPQLCFFDLCDPEKRTHEDIREALCLMGEYGVHVESVILGLNEKESTEICEAFGLEAGDSDHAGLIDRARRISEKCGVTEVVIHPTRCAAAWNRDDSGAVDGPYCANPRLTTGAGDHFNGGYLYARVLGLPPSLAVVVGKCVSGFYVREGRGPSGGEVVSFGRLWVEGKLDPWEGVPD